MSTVTTLGKPAIAGRRRRRKPSPSLRTDEGARNDSGPSSRDELGAQLRERRRDGMHGLDRRPLEQSGRCLVAVHADAGKLNSHRGDLSQDGRPLIGPHGQVVEGGVDGRRAKRPNVGIQPPEQRHDASCDCGRGENGCADSFWGVSRELVALRRRRARRVGDDQQGHLAVFSAERFERQYVARPLFCCRRGQPARTKHESPVRTEEECRRSCPTHFNSLYSRCTRRAAHFAPFRETSRGASGGGNRNPSQDQRGVWGASPTGFEPVLAA